MSGYVVAGYLVALVTLAGYGLTLFRRERQALRRRRGAPETPQS